MTVTAVVRARRSPALVLSPDDGVAAATRAVFRFHLRAFEQQEAVARAGDVEAVHQLRVATRRLRAALRLFAPALPPAFGRRVHAELAWIAGAIGAVRDLDVLADTVRTCATRVDGESRAALGPLALAIHDERTARHTALVQTLDSSRCRRLLEGLRAFADSPPPLRQTRLGDVAPDIIAPLLRDVVRGGRRAAEDSSAPVLHRVRVRAKRLRYALETLDGLGGASLRKMLRRLVRLQDVLGGCQDAVTGMAWLRAWAGRDPHPPATLLATGAIVQALHARERRLRRRFPRAWRRIDRRRLRAGVRDELALHRRVRPDPTVAPRAEAS